MEPASDKGDTDTMVPTGRLRVLLGSGLLLGLFGCGPITATTAIADATVAVEAAGSAEAEKYALYEYTSAVEYLRKAREEEGYSDFQAAIDLAHRARTFGEKARERAMRSPERGLPPPADDDLPTGSGL